MTHACKRQTDPFRLWAELAWAGGVLLVAGAASAADVVSDAKVQRIAAQVRTETGDLPRLQIATDGKKIDLPLEHTHVSAQLEGYVARVEVTQKYKNTYDHPIEAIYVFPLPENSAVDDMRIVIGERVIQAQIQKRDDARRTYDQAKHQGKTAALLEQERPNIFTQSVANIAPGTGITVVVRYLQDLTYDAGEYELVFPMVVGPRFIPGGGVVPDASRITPPILGAGMRSGHDISIDVQAKAGLPIKGADVPTHDTVMIPTLDGSLHLRLAEKASLPNRDFVMRYRVDGAEAEATALAEHDQRGGFLTLIVHPPKLDVDKLLGSRELIFVVDVSGSMHGVPLAMCKDAMREALKGLRPVDTFNILAFSGWTGAAFDQPRPANDANIDDGLKFIGGLQAGGGTHMADAIKAALSPEVGQGRNRYVFFMTDGYVGNEAQILAATQSYVQAHKQRGSKSKVFGFGVGSSVNRYLLDGLGKSGEGLTVYATTREDPTLAVNKFYRYIDASVLEDVSIDWNGLPVKGVYPKAMPDLFASHPLTVHARYDGAGTGKITIRGKHDGKVIELPVQVTLGKEGKKDSALATLWARSKIGDLERDLWSGEGAQTVNAITELGLDYRLVTKYTSFVAVDQNSRVRGQSKTIVQPVEAPEGVDASMAGPAQLMTGSFKDGASNCLGTMGYGGGGLGQAALGRSAPMVVAGKKESERDDGRLAPRKAAATRTEPAAALRVEGTLSTSQILAALAAHKPDIDQCLEQARKTGATGSLTLRWFVTASGAVIQVKRVDGTGEACLVKQLKTWKFPQPTDGQSVSIIYTWTL